MSPFAERAHVRNFHEALLNQVSHFMRVTEAAADNGPSARRDRKSFSNTAHAEFRPDDRLDIAADRIAASTSPANPAGISVIMNFRKS